MKKCTICTICSWIVGLATFGLALAGLLHYDLPSGFWAKVGYLILALIALGFLYYQVVPCSRCRFRAIRSR